MNETVSITTPLWMWHSAEGTGSWHFLTIAGDEGQAIRDHEVMRRLELGSGRGFGSVKVIARIGTSEWRTSVFPSKESKGWLLPVKKAIRKAEDLAEGDEVTVELELT